MKEFQFHRLKEWNGEQSTAHAVQCLVFWGLCIGHKKWSISLLLFILWLTGRRKRRRRRRRKRRRRRRRRRRKRRRQTRRRRRKYRKRRRPRRRGYRPRRPGRTTLRINYRRRWYKVFTLRRRFYIRLGRKPRRVKIAGRFIRLKYGKRFTTLRGRRIIQVLYRKRWIYATRRGRSFTFRYGRRVRRFTLRRGRVYIQGRRRNYRKIWRRLRRKFVIYGGRNSCNTPVLQLNAAAKNDTFWRTTRRCWYTKGWPQQILQKFGFRSHTTSILSAKFDCYEPHQKFPL